MSDQFLQRVRERYLGSGDFNGLYLVPDTPLRVVDAAVELVEGGLVQVVTQDDYINPHIRPWPSRRTLTDQVSDLRALNASDYGLCLYPTPAGMKGVRLPRRFAGRPYESELARGRGDLEIAYFDPDVLEPYRNDPRYHFTYHDFGVNMGIGDEAYLDQEEPERDKLSLSHVGFAYDLSRYDRDLADSRIVRRVAVFYGDLAKLTPVHQQRWKTYEVQGNGLNPHPVWWMNQMGHWADGTGPFERIVFEIENISGLWENAYREPFFATLARPDEFGWILRPSQREWDEFVHQFDKLLSENIRSAALDAANVSSVNAKGQRIGTLVRFQEFMTSNNVTEENARSVLKPLRDVRSARQRPAHALRVNVSDKTYIHKQVALLEDVYESLRAIREWLARHPRNRSYEVENDVDGLGTFYRL